MRRIGLAIVVALSLLAPFVLEAQPATKVWRIGYLGPVSSSAAAACSNPSAKASASAVT
jgi:hypothetical protein